MEAAEITSPIDTRHKKGRSAVSNGNRPMLGSDGRGMWVRRYKDLIEDHANCYGGVDFLSVPRMSLLRRQAAELVECELIEARMSAGEATADDIDRHTRIVGNIRRNYEAMGMDRIARPTDGPLNLSAISGNLKAQRQSGGPE